MFDRLRRLLGLDGPADEAWAALAPDDMRVAAAALLVHVAKIDLDMSEAERRRVVSLVARHFHLDPGAAGRLVETAAARDREAFDVSDFTDRLMRVADAATRAEIVEMLWDVVLTDGSVHAFEDALIWRIAGLLGVADDQSEAIRHRVARSRGVREGEG